MQGDIVHRHIHVSSDISLNNQLQHICKMHTDIMLFSIEIKYCSSIILHNNNNVILYIFLPPLAFEKKYF